MFVHTVAHSLTFFGFGLPVRVLPVLSYCIVQTTAGSTGKMNQSLSSCMTTCISCSTYYNTVLIHITDTDNKE